MQNCLKIISPQLGKLHKHILAWFAIAGEIIHRVVEKLRRDAELRERLEIGGGKDLRGRAATGIVIGAGLIVEVMEFVIHFWIRQFPARGNARAGRPLAGGF